MRLLAIVMELESAVAGPQQLMQRLEKLSSMEERLLQKVLIMDMELELAVVHMAEVKSKLTVA